MSRKSHRKRQAQRRRLVSTTDGQIELSLPGKGFTSGSDVYNFVKKSVYCIARYRVNHKTGTGDLKTLGTGFLAGPYRLVTAAHVINFDDKTKHEDGDIYVFIQRDEFGSYHRSSQTPSENKTLFIYPERDAAVFYFDDDFYSVDGKEIKEPTEHLTFSNRPTPIGTPVGVLGYPLQNIQIENNDIVMESITIRGDRGIVNTGYMLSGIAVCEFTMAFNPGNSGGPIFELETGKVIAVVHSYNSIPLKYVKENIPKENQKELGVKVVHSSVRALYSQGIGAISLQTLENAHGVIFN